MCQESAVQPPPAVTVQPQMTQSLTAQIADAVATVLASKGILVSSYICLHHKNYNWHIPIRNLPITISNRDMPI